jgi:hypothetical protein
VTKVDWGGIRGLLVRTKGTIVGGEFLEELMDLLMQIYSISTKAHCWLGSLEWSSNLLEPQAPPPYKPSMP